MNNPESSKRLESLLDDLIGQKVTDIPTRQFHTIEESKSNIV